MFKNKRQETMNLQQKLWDIDGFLWKINKEMMKKSVENAKITNEIWSYHNKNRKEH